MCSRKAPSAGDLCGKAARQGAAAENKRVVAYSKLAEGELVHTVPLCVGDLVTEPHAQILIHFFCCQCHITLIPFHTAFLPALIPSVIIEMTDEMLTCSSHSIYPAPQVTWATDPPSDQEALENSTIKTTDSKGLFTVESTLRIVAGNSNYTYACSFISADKAQVWTASHKNQGALSLRDDDSFVRQLCLTNKSNVSPCLLEDITQEEGQPLFIPCISPHSLRNFSLTWTFTSSGTPTVIMRYDSRTRHTFNLWEDQAELDQDMLLQGNGSVVLRKPEREEHSGTYTCTFLGLQSRHIIQTTVNITVASISEYNSR